jgi:hypothetical protein
MSKILRDLHRSCQKEDGSDDQRKGTQLLEVYAVEIQMHTEQKNTKQLKQLYNSALGVKSAIPHPRIMGIIRECGGKMHMAERTWADAATDFFEAFKSYDEVLWPLHPPLPSASRAPLGWFRAPHPVPQVLGASKHADEQHREPV